MNKTELILGENELNLLAKKLSLSLNLSQQNEPKIILLQGDLASGKTTLVKALAKSLGFMGEVSSPTFSVMQKYEVLNLDIFHYDIYQNGFDSMLKNGLFENFFEDGLHLVEWGDDALKNALNKLNLSFIIIKISPFENKRKYEIYE